MVHFDLLFFFFFWKYFFLHSSFSRIGSKKGITAGLSSGTRRGCEGTLIILDPRMFTLRDPPPASSSAKEQGFSLSCACAGSLFRSVVADLVSTDQRRELILFIINRPLQIN